MSKIVKPGAFNGSLPKANEGIPGVRLFVIYESPSDYPGMIVVREQIALTTGAVIASGTAWIPNSLEDARKFMVDRGLTCVPRSPQDDPVILESWL